MPNQPPITCRQLLAFILDYVEGALSPGERAEFERHLALCPSCVAYLEGYKRTIELGRAAMLARLPPSDEPADGMAPAGLIEAVRAARLRAR